MGFGTRKMFALKNHGPGMLHQIICSGVMCVLLLLIVGCSGGDPEPQPPAVDSPATGYPGDPGAADMEPESPDATEATAPEANSIPESTDSGQTPEETTAPATESTPEATAPSALDQALGGAVEEVLQGKPRTRPDDVTKWVPTDLVPAFNENDPKLGAAIKHYAQNNLVGNPIAAKLLTFLLTPKADSPAANPQGNEMGMYGDPGMGGYGATGGQTQQIDQQMVELLIAALAVNNTPDAAQTLRSIIEGKFKPVQSQVATKAAIQALAVMDADRPKNDFVLFTALTDASKYRKVTSNNSGGMGYGGGMPGGGMPAGEQQMSAEQLSQQAEQTLKTLASESLRLLLADYILKDSTSAVDRQKFRAWFTESQPVNLPSQLKIYEASPPDPELMKTIEQNVTAYSGIAMARLFGVLPTTPDLSLLGQAGGMGAGIPSQPSTGWGSGGAMGGGGGMGMPGYSSGFGGGSGMNADLINQILAEKVKKISPEEELVRLAKQFWGPEVAKAVAIRLNETPSQNMAAGGGAYGGMGGGGTGSDEQSLALASTMPLDSVRYAILQRCKNRYQHGPNVALGNSLGQAGGGMDAGMDPAMTAAAGAMGGGGGMGMGGANSGLQVIDPGLLVILKMLPRENPNAPLNGARGARPDVAAGYGAGAGGNMQHQWFATSQQLVAKLFAQCLGTASSMSGEEPGFDASDETEASAESEANEEQVSNDPCPLTPHNGAQVVARLDLKLPDSAQATLGTLPVAPTEVHYVRIEEMANLQRVMNYYKRAVKGQNHMLSGNMGWWYDGIVEGTTPGRKRSIDVVISPGQPKPVSPFDEGQGRRVKGVPIVVQILTVETADPSVAR